MYFPPELKNSVLMLVDDNRQNLRMLVNHFKDFDFRLLVAQSGPEALDLLKNVTPDLILLDVLMPGMNGFEVCERIKANPALPDIPIIFLTALTETVDEVKGFELGAVDYITKPTKLEKVMARTITQLTIQRQRRQLQRQQQEMTELNVTKDRFFSIMAHDLRSPFVTLLSLINLTKEAKASKDLQSELNYEMYFEQLTKTYENAYKLLENLLEWASFQEGKMEFNPEQINLAGIIHTIVDLYQPIAGHKGIHISHQVPPDTLVFCDQHMFTTVVRNLVNNAIKYTRTGGSVAIHCQLDDPNYVEIQVHDNGVGMDETTLIKLFRLDQKLKTTGTANEKGTGLGLILCHDFVSRNGGRIWVESEKGKGSIFKFTAPRPSIEKQDQTPITVLPPNSEIEKLREHCLLGDISRLQNKLVDINALNPDYAPFVAHVRQLTDKFEIEKALHYLNSALK